MFFQTLFLNLLNRAPLCLGRVPAASIVGAVGGSSSSRRVDPRADLLEATERNAREAREEREAEERRAAREAKQKSAEARAVAAAKAQAEAADAEREAEAQQNQPPQFVIPLRAAAPDTPVPPLEEASRGQPEMEREVAPSPPTGAGRGSRPEVPTVQPAGGEPTVGGDLVISSPLRRRAGKATSAPDAQKTVDAGSSAQDLEAASDSSSGWTPGGGTAVLNVAAQDVRSRLQSQATALKQYTQEFLATRSAIRVSLLALDFFRGGASAHPLGVVPEFRVGC